MCLVYPEIQKFGIPEIRIYAELQMKYRVEVGLDFLVSKSPEDQVCSLVAPLDSNCAGTRKRRMLFVMSTGQHAFSSIGTGNVRP